MPWEFLAVRRPSDDLDDALFPEITEDAAGVVAATGEQLEPLRASSLRTYEVISGTTLTRLNAVAHRSTLWLGTERLAVSCEAYNRPTFIAGGGGPVALVTLALSSIRTVSARRKRRGTLLVGQVRYQWLSVVGLRKRTLRLGVTTVETGRRRMLLLDVALRKEVDAGAVAKQIINRAARLQLAATPETATEVRRRLEELAADPTPKVAEGKKSFSAYVFPHPWPVAPATADPGKLEWFD